MTAHCWLHWRRDCGTKAGYDASGPQRRSRAIAAPAGSAKTALARYLPDARTIVARALNSVPVAGTLCITHPIAKLDGAAYADTLRRCADNFFCCNVQQRAGARCGLATDLSTLVADFGKEASVGCFVVCGNREEQLRSPLESLVEGVAVLSGILSGGTLLITETRMSGLFIRPDYAVMPRLTLWASSRSRPTVKGRTPRRLTDAHDKEQWEKLRALPNLTIQTKRVQRMARRRTDPATAATASAPRRRRVFVRCVAAPGTDS